MNPQKKRIAIKSALFTALLSTAAWVQAAPVIGTVVHLSGPLFVNQANGNVRVLGAHSPVEVGDTLSTKSKAYVQIRFADNSVLTLQPDTELTIDALTYDVKTPATDAMVIALKRGGIRTEAGALGKRSPNSVTLITPTAKIALQSASVVVQYRPATDAVAEAMPPSGRLASIGAWLSAAATDDDSPAVALLTVTAARFAYSVADVLAWLEALKDDSGVDSNVAAPSATFAVILPPSSPTALPPGLYVQVLDGLIHVTNPSGTQNFSAGQFGFTPAFTSPPVLIPTNPGIQFTLPPVFNSSVTSTSTGSVSTKSGSVDCEVR